jgi:hypothetical protein
LTPALLLISSAPQEYFAYSNEGGEQYLLNAFTGEVITNYALDEYGSVIADRRLSYWRPVDPQVIATASRTKAAAKQKTINKSQQSNCAFLQRFDGSMYKASWHAAEVIQRAIRGTLGRWILQRALVTVYIRTHDDQTGYYYFTHTASGDSR